MKVIACVKQTPSTTATFSVADNVVSWEDTGSGKPNVVNPWDEYCVEEGIRLKENHGATAVVALTAGPAGAVDVLRTSLAMGCTEAFQVADDAIAGLDANDNASVLAAAIQKVGDAQIVLCGKQAIDGDSGVTPIMVARKLGWTPLTYVSAIKSVADGKITVERMLESGVQEVTASLPVVISVVREINEPRYPSFMGIRKANKAQIPTVSMAELDVEVKGSTNVSWGTIYAPEQRAGAVEIMSGDLSEQVKTLVDRLFEEKVI
ncbi:MAG: electron transfer flavoprotein beta subunit [Cellvibrionaceae bacterium]|jgi:electron transfer flavoprotein beta subunit